MVAKPTRPGSSISCSPYSDWSCLGRGVYASQPAHSSLRDAACHWPVWPDTMLFYNVHQTLIMLKDAVIAAGKT